MYFHDMEIYVDVMGQLEINLLFNKNMPKSAYTPVDFAKLMQTAAFDRNHLELPIFPLNTDGIDANGRNITFRRVKITNFDDAIVAKPGNKAKHIPCTQDVLVEDCEVIFGVGMSIGSIPPSEHHTCVRDWTVRNVNFKYPFKAIYIKTNPGEGTGEIKNILYENITIDTPIWWGIYIGPQQMKEPDGRGPGCMIYPLNKDCPTQPLIDISNITLRNISSTGGLLPAGIIRCNASNPCTNFTFDNVDVRSQFWDSLGYGYITEYTEGVSTNSFPIPGFKPVGYYQDIPLSILEDESYGFDFEFALIRAGIQLYLFVFEKYFDYFEAAGLTKLVGFGIETF